MRKKLTYLFLCFILQGALWAQQESLQLPESAGESIILSCDREFYGVSENIHYFASYNSPEELESVSWSTVLYVELISWDGTKQASSKVQITNHVARGKIEIPKTIPSGVYFLRAYTKWMRNYSPRNYAYLPVKILNPFSQEMLARPAEGETDLQSIARVAEVLNDGILVSGMMNHYGTREQVELDIQIQEELISGPYSLGIAKSSGQSSGDYNMEYIPVADTGSGTIEFLPELNGLTLSGSVVDAETSEPVSGAKLQLSSYANPFFYAELLSGKDGSFLCAFPYFNGTPELHIAEASDSSLNHNVLLASEFCNKPIRLPYLPLEIDSLEQAAVRETLVNIQLKERYRQDAPGIDQGESSSPAFYGSGASATYVEDYIELADLGEFIYEIIPQVSIHSNNEGSFIRIQGPSCMEIYPPLVLMDNVPVPNNNDLLNIPSNRIERIEVLNQAYMVGNIRYSGILSVYSSNKDMSGLDQDGERHFFNLRMLDDNSPGFKYGASSRESSIPDIRNLLYWEPGIEFSEEGTYRINFSTPDSPGQYVLTIRGTDPENSNNVLEKALILVK